MSKPDADPPQSTGALKPGHRPRLLGPEFGGFEGLRLGHIRYPERMDELLDKWQQLQLEVDERRQNLELSEVAQQVRADHNNKTSQSNYT